MIAICGGKIVTPEGVWEGDILIKGERFAQVGGRVEEMGVRTVDASGLMVLPGLVDAHVHLRDPGQTHKEDFFTGTCAALAGGVTTILDMPNTTPPLTSAQELSVKREAARRKAVADYGFFLGATRDNWMNGGEATGEVGLKMFLGGAAGELLVDDFAAQYLHMCSYPPQKVLAIHAEDEESLCYFAAHPAGPGHSGTHPPVSAVLAVARALVMATVAYRRLHICHISTPQELKLIKAAKARGLKVTCEVTPHHLFLTQDGEARLGPLGKMNPPLRSRAEVEALWQNLSAIDLIATDHAPHTLAEKRSPSPPSGVPGLETMLPLLATAVSRGRLTWEELVRLTAAGPAQAYGLKGKGKLAPGYEADLVLLDPKVEWEIDERLFTKCGWTPFLGWKVRGKVVSTYLRGREVFRQGEILAQPGYGREVCLASGGITPEEIR